MNVFTTNVVISDLLSATLHPLAVHSAERGRWKFGQLGKAFNNISKYLNLNFFKLQDAAYMLWAYASSHLLES